MGENVVRSSLNVLLASGSAPVPVVAIRHGRLASSSFAHAKRTKLAIPLAVKRGMDGLGACRSSKQEEKEEGFHGFRRGRAFARPSIVLTNGPLVNPLAYQRCLSCRL